MRPSRAGPTKNYSKWKLFQTIFLTAVINEKKNLKKKRKKKIKFELENFTLGALKFCSVPSIYANDFMQLIAGPFSYCPKKEAEFVKSEKFRQLKNK